MTTRGVALTAVQIVSVESDRRRAVGVRAAPSHGRKAARMTRAWQQTRCTRCGHEERRYVNVKRCRACHGPLERVEAADERDVEIARLRAKLELARQIVDRARLWAAHDAELRELLREWEAL